MIEGVLFDLEDTLVVSESYGAGVEQVTLGAIARAQRCSIHEAEELFRRTSSLHPTTSATVEALGVSREELHAQLERVRLLSPVRVMNGVPQVLHWLVKRGIKLGLVTNMPRGLTLEVLRSAGIPVHLFAAIVTGSDISQPKPAAEPFLRALDLIKLPPCRCLMVGDREEVDLDPAKELGITTALVGDMALRAHYTLSSLSKIEGLITT